MLGKSVIYPHVGASEAKRAQAGGQFRRIVEQYGVTLVAIGNGTASRESEQFVAEQLRQIPRKVVYTIVSEAGPLFILPAISRVKNSQITKSKNVLQSASLVVCKTHLQNWLKIDPKAVGLDNTNTTCQKNN